MKATTLFYIVCVNVLLVNSFSIAQNKPSVRILNYTNTSNVLMYKKLELAIVLQNEVQQKIENFIKNEEGKRLNIPKTEIVNPFLEWELDVEGVFTHTSGERKVIDGFFTRNMQRNYSTDVWDALPNTEHMRVRIAPSKAGEWSYYVRVKLNGISLDSSVTQKFTVSTIPFHGFVKVHENNKNFSLDGKMIFPVGQNFPNPDEFNTEYTHSASESAVQAPVKCWVSYLNKIETYAKLGGKYIRTIQCPYGQLIEWEKKGNYFARMHYAQEQDVLLDLADKYDLFINFNLMIQEPFMQFACFGKWTADWDQYIDYPTGLKYEPTKHPINPYNDAQGKKLPHEMFLNEEDLKYHEQRTRYYIARYGYSTQIYTFEQLSEPYHLDQFCTNNAGIEPYLDRTNPMNEVVMRAVETYSIRMSKFIKVNMQHTDHLISVNATGPAWTPDDHLKYHDKSIQSEYVDVVGFNYYANSPNRFMISRMGKSNENSIAKMVEDFQKASGKLVYISEGEHSVGECDAINASKGEVQPIDNASFPFIGIGGFALWHNFQTNRFNSWENQATTYQFVTKNILPVLNEGKGKYTQNKQLAFHKSGVSFWNNDAVPLKEHQYYVSESKTKAAGYIRNQTYNLYTLADSSYTTCTLENNASNGYYLTLRDIEWNEGNDPIKVKNLKRRTNFTVEYFDIFTGKSISTQCVRSGANGTIVLQHPALLCVTGKRPIVWYTLRESDCR